MTASEMNKIQKALREQKEMLDGEVQKKQAPKGVSKKVAELQNSETDFTTVGDGTYKNDCLIYRLDKEVNKVAAMYSTRSAQSVIRQQYESGEITWDEWRDKTKEIKKETATNLLGS